jgi:alcohol dehydrogenase class IV
MESIGVVRRLRDFGLRHEDCPSLVKAVQGNLTTDPTDSSTASLQAIYEESV